MCFDYVRIQTLFSVSHHGMITGDRRERKDKFESCISSKGMHAKWTPTLSAEIQTCNHYIKINVVRISSEAKKRHCKCCMDCFPIENRITNSLILIFLRIISNKCLDYLISTLIPKSINLAWAVSFTCNKYNISSLILFRKRGKIGFTYLSRKMEKWQRRLSNWWHFEVKLP